MTHYGLICPNIGGHFNSMIAVGQELQKRKHQVTVINLIDSQEKIIRSGLPFCPIGEKDFPIGSTEEHLNSLGSLTGIEAFEYMITLFLAWDKVYLNELAERLKHLDIEFLLIDQTQLAPCSVADCLDLPYINISNALILNYEISIPPIQTSWNYRPACWAKLRNLWGHFYFGARIKPIYDQVIAYRRAKNLFEYKTPNDSFSRLAQISQQPATFEFPRTQLPRQFHFCGPLHDLNGHQSMDFPFEQLTDQPLVYTSLGTIQNRLLYLYEMIATACASLDVQLVISLGGSTQPSELPSLPGSPIVVEYAPQLELIRRSDLVITHGGLNTTLESLAHGVPLIAIPITNDQPGVAARIQWTGVGEFLPISKVHVQNLQQQILQVLTDPKYHQNAKKIQQDIQNSGGVKFAVDIIKKAAASGKAVESRSP